MSWLRRIARQSLGKVIGADRALVLSSGIIDFVGGVSYRLSPSGRRSSARLRAYRDAYVGRRCFVIGNGPSVAGMDIGPLRNEVTFGLNRGYLLFGRIGAPTTFLVSINRLVIEQSGHEIAAAESTKILSWAHRRLVKGDDRSIIWVRTTRKARFSVDPVRQGLWEGATVTFAALQLAYYMGFDTVVLIGVDHSFTTKGPAHQVVTSAAGDMNHFDPAYFGPGYRWQLPDLETSEIAYELARRAFADADREVVDATVDGKLTIFPKAEYESFIR